MDLNYSKDKPKTLMTIWKIMEDMDEKYPYSRFGWNGFLLMRIEIE